MHPMTSYATTWILLLMAARWLSPDTFILVLSGSVLLILIGLFPSTCEKFINELLRLLLLFRAFRDFLLARINRMKSTLSTLRRENGMVQGSVLLARVGAFLLILPLTFIVFLSEIYFSAETARAVFSHDPSAYLPVLSDLKKYTDWMVGISISSGALLWGIYLSDAKGHSNLTPIHDRPAAQRKWVQFNASLLLVLVLSLLLGFAVYRSIDSSLENGAGRGQASGDFTNDELDLLMMDGNDETNPLPEDNIPKSRFEQPLMHFIQLTLVVIIFSTLVLSDWLIGSAMIFAGMAMIMLALLPLLIVWGSVCVIYEGLEFVGLGLLVSTFQFTARIATSMASPLAAHLGLEYVDDAQAFLNSLDTPNQAGNDGSENALNFSDIEPTADGAHPDTQADPGPAHADKTEADDDEPDAEETTNYNWSPFKK